MSSVPKPRYHRALTKEEAISFIAARYPRRRHDTDEAIRDRARNLVNMALRSNQFKFINGRIKFEDLVQWARTRRPLADRFPDFPVITSSTGPVVNFGTPTAVRGTPIPAELVDCQACLRDAYRALLAKDQEIDVLRRENERLRPIAAKYDAMRESLRAAGKKSRRTR